MKKSKNVLFILVFAVSSCNLSIFASDSSEERMINHALVRACDWHRIVVDNIQRMLGMFAPDSVIRDFVRQENAIINARYQEDLDSGVPKEQALTDVCRHLTTVNNFVASELQEERVRRATRPD